MTNKKFTIMAATTAMTVAMSMTAFAAGWQKNDAGWWYGTNDANTEWYANGWQWVDGNGDGTAECYYFDENGYMLAGTTTPDGYTVNANGAWIDGNAVQTKNVEAKSQVSSDEEGYGPLVGTFILDGTKRNGDILKIWGVPGEQTLTVQDPYTDSILVYTIDTTSAQAIGIMDDVYTYYNPTGTRSMYVDVDGDYSTVNFMYEPGSGTYIFDRVV